MVTAVKPSITALHVDRRDSLGNGIAGVLTVDGYRMLWQIDAGRSPTRAWADTPSPRYVRMAETGPAIRLWPLDMPDIGWLIVNAQEVAEAAWTLACVHNGRRE